MQAACRVAKLLVELEARAMAESGMASKRARVIEPPADKSRARDLSRPAELVKLLKRA